MRLVPLNSDICGVSGDCNNELLFKYQASNTKNAVSNIAHDQLKYNLNLRQTHTSTVVCELHTMNLKRVVYTAQ